MAAHGFESQMDRALAANRLGLGTVLSAGLSCVAPFTVAAGLITAFLAVTGIVAVPFTLLLVLAVLAIFSLPFLRMSTRVSNAGAFYSYITLGLGRPIGMSAAVIALVAYNCLQVALYGMFGYVVGGLLDAHGVHHSWWVWALVAWVAVAVMGTIDIKWVNRLLGVLVVAEVLVISALDVNGLAHPAPGQGYLGAFSPAGLTTVSLPIAGAMAVLTYVGFETMVVYRVEARRPSRTITIATLLALISMFLVYGLTAWALIVHYGVGDVVATAQAQGPGMVFGLGSGWLSTAGQWLFVTSLLAAMMAFHQAVARYTYVLGRERVLFRFFERTNGFRAPYWASVLQSLIGLATIVVYAVEDWSPTVQMFFWLGQTGGFLVTGLLALTSLAMLVFYARSAANRAGINVLVWLVSPLVALVALSWLFVQVWIHYSPMLGEQAPSLASKLLPQIWIPAAIVGLALAGWMFLARRGDYQAVGRDNELPEQPVGRHNELAQAAA